MGEPRQSLPGLGGLDPVQRGAADESGRHRDCGLPPRAAHRLHRVALGRRHEAREPGESAELAVEVPAAGHVQRIPRLAGACAEAEGLPAEGEADAAGGAPPGAGRGIHLMERAVDDEGQQPGEAAQDPRGV